MLRKIKYCICVPGALAVSCLGLFAQSVVKNLTVIADNPGFIQVKFSLSQVALPENVTLDVGFEMQNVGTEIRKTVPLLTGQDISQKNYWEWGSGTKALIRSNNGRIPSDEELTAILEIKDLWEPDVGMFKVFVCPKLTGENFSWDIDGDGPLLDIHWIWVEGGEYPIGRAGEGPESDVYFHSVNLTSGYWIANRELSVGEWNILFPGNPKQGDTDKALEKINWYDAVQTATEFDQLLRMDGLIPEGFVCSIPTEAEWEIAARGGHVRFQEDPELFEKGYFFNILDESHSDYAYFGESPGSSVVRGDGSVRKANPLGLYDIYGNVSEWVWDGFGNYAELDQEDPISNAMGQKVHRGGHYDSSPTKLNSFQREAIDPLNTGSPTGVRLVISSIPRPIPEKIDFYLGNSGIRMNWIGSEVEGGELIRDVLGYSNRNDVNATGYWMSETEITESQFSYFAEGGLSAVESLSNKPALVNWNDANEWSSSLNEYETALNLEFNPESNFHFGLPSEEEWSFSAGGSPGLNNIENLPDYFFSQISDLDQFAIYSKDLSNVRSSVENVKSLMANPFGLYDVYGNAREWLRKNSPTQNGVFTAGGFYESFANQLRTKTSITPASSSAVGTGFRIVLSPFL